MIFIPQIILTTTPIIDLPYRFNGRQSRLMNTILKSTTAIALTTRAAAITSYVHVDQNLNNAFWTHNLIAFGDGNNNNPLVELDVVAHELTHGVTQYEANLQYYYESGALNESFSDIFGKAVEFDTFGDSGNLAIGQTLS